jgi:hypothetical protein
MRALALACGVMLMAASSASADCAAKISVPWKSAKALGLTLEARAVGPTCASGAVVLLVLDAKGQAQWSTTRIANQNAFFMDGITDNASMQAALKNWLAEGEGTGPNFSKDLPDWKAGAEQAEREGDGEFGFFAGEGVDREYYMNIRKENQPLYCFVQGIESTTCIAAGGSTSINEIGGFTFPG